MLKQRQEPTKGDRKTAEERRGGRNSSRRKATEKSSRPNTDEKVIENRYRTRKRRKLQNEYQEKSPRRNRPNKTSGHTANNKGTCA